MKPTSYNCKFCSQPTQHAPLEDMSKHGINIFFCHHCQTEYTFWQSGDSSSQSIYAMINNRMYRWTITSESGKAYLWHIGKPGIPGVFKNEETTMIKVFKNDVPEITPQNFAEKLKTYLVFL